MSFGRLLLTLTLALFAFVSISEAGVPTRNKADAEAGKDIWLQSCWQCHGRVAGGEGPASTALAGPVPSLKSKVTADSMPEFIATVREGRGTMPGYGDVLTKRDAKRVLIYVQSLDNPTKRKGAKSNASGKKGRKGKSRSRKGRKGKIPPPGEKGKKAAEGAPPPPSDAALPQDDDAPQDEE